MEKVPTEEIFPVEVQLKQEEGLLNITWSDDHVSPFTLAYVRGWCPCARCQGHFQAELHYQDASGASLVLDNAEPVGNYGMRLTWGDRHDSGIYAFDELRGMCTCAQCDPEGKRVTEKVRQRYPSLSRQNGDA